jgi:hypothetical protein
MTFLTKTAELNLYENPIPALVSRQAAFPGLVKLPSGDLLALFTIGQAFESADRRTYVSRSTDLGESWTLEGLLYDDSALGLDYPISECYKSTVLNDGSLIATGYGVERRDPEKGMIDPVTGQMLPGVNWVLFSSDEGKTWGMPKPMGIEAEKMIELSGPAVCLPSGRLLTAGPLFHVDPTGQYGLAIASDDNGQSWKCLSRYYSAAEENIAPWETRLTVGPDGQVVAIWWAYNTVDNVHLPNMVAISRDEGATWSDPIDTGIEAQASNMLHLEGTRYLSIHCHRADATPGLFVRLVDLADDKWTVAAEEKIWGNFGSQDSTVNMAEQFDNLKFGQPSLLKLDDKQFLAAHWCVENGQYVIKTHRLQF